jgi:deoxyribonuclease (pyrimidine dimer)
LTRVNAGIHPEELPGKLLLAEHREIIRIPNCINSGRAIIKNLPSVFTLNKGHVKFFYNKLEYIKKRYILIYEECLKRGYKVTDMSGSFIYRQDLYNDWEETQEARALLLERIRSKGFNIRGGRD